MALVRLFLFCLLPKYHHHVGKSSSSSMMHDDDDETVSSLDSSLPLSSPLQQQTLDIALVRRASK